MNQPERFESERVVLRKPRMEDAPAIFEGYAQDLEVTRYLTWKPHRYIRETEEYCWLASRYGAQEKILPMSLRQKMTTRQLDIFRVQAFCDVDNIGSARLMEKVGMQCGGLLRSYVLHPNLSDEPRDVSLYAIVK